MSDSVAGRVDRPGDHVAERLSRGQDVLVHGMLGAVGVAGYDRGHDVAVLLVPSEDHAPVGVQLLGVAASEALVEGPWGFDGPMSWRGGALRPLPFLTCPFGAPGTTRTCDPLLRSGP